jgi:hypothetical protein
MAKGRVDYGSWALRVIAWDAVLAACIAFLPLGVKLLFPDRRGVMEVTAVILPIVAFLLRFRAGKRHVASNHCSKAVRRFQLGVFCLGILPLALVDCVIILSDLMPKGALFASEEDRTIWAILLSIYLGSMIIAMYPGRTIPSPDGSDDPFAFQEIGAGDE